MAVKRFDTGTLGNVTKTPQGGIKVPAALTRTGVLVYRNPDGSPRREFRPADEVFSDSMATLKDATVTNLHPPSGFVKPKTFAKVSVGHVSSAPRQDGDKVVAELTIQDGYVISLIESGERKQVSCGYECDLDWTPGTTPEGERYDCIQRNIVYNHVALVPRGRAGDEVALRLDSEENQLAPEGEEKKEAMKFERIDGVEYEVGTEAHSAALARRKDADDARSAEVAKLTAERDTLKAQVEELTKRLDAQKDEILESVKERTALVSQAKKYGAEVREDMADLDIRKAIIQKVLPSMNLDGKDEAYVKTTLDVALSGDIGNANETRAKIVGDPTKRVDAAPTDEEPPDQIARKKMIAKANGRSVD